MARADFIASQKQAIVSGQDSVIQGALEATWDQAAQEQKASDGTLTQEDLDAAIQSATQPLKDQIEQDRKDLQDAHADAEQKLAALQQQFNDAVTAKEAEDAVVKNFQNKSQELQSALDAIKALIFPQP